MESIHPRRPERPTFPTLGRLLNQVRHLQQRRAEALGTLIYNIFTIGAAEGRARGAGNEFLISINMRFATKGESIFGQPEAGSGLFPGGGGSQFLPG
ncbi:hypothetical protein CI238_07088 [Colletotrichum incanum]|uniref:Uncharacterized protein n=1 Tax=Colletotrichum incanum TaxID=1573173 RepID=A0A166MRR2_COLIC|nr:hypothetical protein CI238_07088 [Colletotrichum incanum]